MISALSLSVWWAKLEKSNQVRHNMTQRASVLAVATIFIILWTRTSEFLIREGGGAYKYLCRNLSQKCRGGISVRGGVILGFYGILITRLRLKSVYRVPKSSSHSYAHMHCLQHYSWVEYPFWPVFEGYLWTWGLCVRVCLQNGCMYMYVIWLKYLVCLRLCIMYSVIYT